MEDQFINYKNYTKKITLFVNILYVLGLFKANDIYNIYNTF